VNATRATLPQSPEGSVPSRKKPTSKRKPTNPQRRLGAQPLTLPGNPEGDLIEKARLAMDISQSEAAARAGMHRNQWWQTVQRVKTNPRPRRWARCAVVVNVPPEMFRRIGRADIADEIAKLLWGSPVTDAAAEPMSVLDHLIAIQESFGPEAFWTAVDVLIKEMQLPNGDPGKVGV
jgi:hypothetical protein